MTKTAAGRLSLVASGMFLLLATSDQQPVPASAEELAVSLPEEAQEVLQKAAALKSYRARFALEAREESGQAFRLHGTLAFEMPNRRRLEIREGEAQEPSQILVADGEKEWQYHPKSGVVYRLLEPPQPPGPHRPFAEAKPQTLRFVRRVGEGKEGRLQFEAEPLPSAAEGAPAPIQRLRIEVGEQDGLARKLELLDPQGQTVLTQEFTEVEPNVSLDPAQFVFVPEQGMAVVDIP